MDSFETFLSPIRSESSILESVLSEISLDSPFGKRFLEDKVESSNTQSLKRSDALELTDPKISIIGDAQSSKQSLFEDVIGKQFSSAAETQIQDKFMSENVSSETINENLESSLSLKKCDANQKIETSPTGSICKKERKKSTHVGEYKLKNNSNDFLSNSEKKNLSNPVSFSNQENIVDCVAHTVASDTKCKTNALSLQTDEQCFKENSKKKSLEVKVQNLQKDNLKSKGIKSEDLVLKKELSSLRLSISMELDAIRCLMFDQQASFNRNLNKVLEEYRNAQKTNVYLFSVIEKQMEINQKLLFALASKQKGK